MNFDSPLGRKQAAMASAGQKVFTVDDPGFDYATQVREEHLAPAREAQKRTTPDAKKRLDLLLGIGRTTKDVMIEGYKFTLRSLKSSEMKEIVTAASKVQGTEFMFEMRTQTLARSLVKIEDQPIELIIDNNTLEARLYYIEECEDHIVHILYTAYTDMIKENQEKYGVKNEKEAQEVLDQVKK